MTQYRPTREEFRRALWRAALPPLLLLAALAAFVCLLLFQLHRANTFERQSEEIIANTTELERLLLSMETGMRGFMLSGDDTFLKPYEEANAQIDPVLRELQQRLQNNPPHLERIDDVRRALNEWMSMESGLRSAKLAPADPTSLGILRQRRQLMDSMQESIHQMLITESQLRRRRHDDFQRASTLAVLGSIGLSMSLGIGLALLNRRSIIRLSTVYQQALDAEDARASELAASNKQFLDLAEAIPQLVWMSDNEGKAIYFNRSWSMLTGCAIETLMQNGWEDALHPDDKAAAAMHWKDSLRTGQPFEAEYRIRHGSDGSYRWFLCRAMPVRDDSGRHVRWFGTCTDIESQKQLEHEREAVLAASQKARGDLLRTNLIKDQFLATLSHELRTPMTAILGWTQLLKDPVIREKSLDRAIEAIDNNARAQARLIEDLLDMSRILSGKLTIKPEHVDLREVVKSAVNAVGPAVAARRVNLVQEVPAEGDFELQGDPARLQQVIWNLLSNAVKFTPQGGHVGISLERTDNHAKIVVTDTGRGIRPEFLPHVFELFRQADGSTTRQTGGLGLGLAIVKHLVEMHGGTVWVTSDGEDRGASFTVELPISPAVIVSSQLGTPVESQDAGVSLRGLRVLVVEDDRDAAEIVRTILERAGASVDSASNGIDGLARFDQHRFDVMISDIGMPGMDGYSLIRKIREKESATGHHLPAIALTAFANKEDCADALTAGYQVHLSKPVAAEELIRSVATVAQNPVRN